jgi:hypothetical protein
MIFAPLSELNNGRNRFSNDLERAPALDYRPSKSQYAAQAEAWNYTGDGQWDADSI